MLCTRWPRLVKSGIFSLCQWNGKTEAAQRIAHWKGITVIISINSSVPGDELKCVKSVKHPVTGRVEERSKYNWKAQPPWVHRPSSSLSTGAVKRLGSLDKVCPVSWSIILMTPTLKLYFSHHVLSSLERVLLFPVVSFLDSVENTAYSHASLACVQGNSSKEPLRTTKRAHTS